MYDYAAWEIHNKRIKHTEQHRGVNQSALAESTNATRRDPLIWMSNSLSELKNRFKVPIQQPNGHNLKSDIYRTLMGLLKMNLLNTLARMLCWEFSPRHLVVVPRLFGFWRTGDTSQTFSCIFHDDGDTWVWGEQLQRQFSRLIIAIRHHHEPVFCFTQCISLICCRCYCLWSRG